MIEPGLLVEALPIAIVVIDRAHRFAYANAHSERVMGIPELAGKHLDDVLSAVNARIWRTAIEAALASRQQRGTEIKVDEAGGVRRLASVVAPFGEDLVCIASRDITEVRSTVVIDRAARTMGTGMMIVEAPSGRVVFENDETQRMFGSRMHVAGVRDYDDVIAYDSRGEKYTANRWPVARAIAGENVVDELVELQRADGTRRWLNVQASPVRDRAGTIVAAVSTCLDVTESKRANEASTYLADAGRILDQLDPATSLQKVVELAIPVLADWGFVHLKRPDGPWTVAIANRDPAKLAAARGFVAGPLQLSQKTALARVLAGGPRELVDVDAATLEDAAHDPEHLRQLREWGYRSAIVVPLTARDEVLGAITFVMAESGRRYDATDLETLADLARRTANALDNARLLEAERQARRQAEEARDRTRRLQELTSKLSRALEKAQVVSTVVDEGRAAVGAPAGFAWLLRDPETLEMVASANSGPPTRIEPFRTFSTSTAFPICEVIRTGEPLMFESPAAMSARFPAAAPPDSTPFKAWAVIPLFAGGCPVGGVAFSFANERTFSEEDRELLGAMAGQASLALERCVFVEQLRHARAVADAATSRERKLREVAEQMSRALTPKDIAELASREVVAFLGAEASLTAIRDGDKVRIVGVHGPYDPTALSRVLAVPVEYDIPIAEAMSTGALVWVGTRAALEQRYAHVEYTWRPRGVCSWGAVPFTFEDSTVGAIALSFTHDHELTENEREFLSSIGQLTAFALERARLYDRLQQQNEELEFAVARAHAADRRKDEFLAMLGHELRNPLAPIATALQVMDTKLETQVLGRERDVIRRQVTHLTRLIDDLLDVSRITRGKITLQRQVIEVGSVIAKALEIASPLLEKRRQHVVVDVPHEGLRVDGDPTRLAEVLQNLIMNASKYSDPQTTIHVAAHRTADQIVVDVRDEGIGIGPDLLPHLFEMFVQGERVLDRSQGGLGLGLTIAKSLCELHGGAISATSQGHGCGSMFTVTLPHVVRAETSADVQPTAPRSTSGVRVLVVDDNVDAAEMLHAILSYQGHDAVIAHDAIAALELAASFKPEVAVLDIGLPVMDGYELARRLRADVGLDRLRLIAVTGYGQDADRARARDAGFDHHLVKPIELTALIPLLDGELR